MEYQRASAEVRFLGSAHEIDERRHGQFNIRLVVFSRSDGAQNAEPQGLKFLRSKACPPTVPPHVKRSRARKTGVVHLALFVDFLPSSVHKHQIKDALSYHDS